MVSPGPLSTVQDLGRPGFGHLGIGTSGAADRASLRLANQLVGNEKQAAAIEMTLGRLRLRCDFDAVLALTGAPCPFTVGGRAAGMNRMTVVRTGDEIRVGAPTTGLRTYLAVRGGIDVPTVLGSRSTDTLSGIGPEKLYAGMVLPVGEDRSTEHHGVEHPRSDGPAADGPTGDDPTEDGPTGDGPMKDAGASWTRLPSVTAAAEVVAAPAELVADPVLTVLAGPRDDWFTAEAWQTLCSATWTVTAEANRIGVRLAGPSLERRVHRELPSEPMVVGALQVPPNGQPILFLADHPVTGGYPVIGVISAADLHLAGQLRPGRTVRFRQG